MGDYQHLIVERRGPVGWLVNDRPDQLNAMNSRMRDEFADAWLELDDDPEVRVIVHTGNGRAFQTGVDVAEIAGDGVGMERYRQSVEDFLYVQWRDGALYGAKPADAYFVRCDRTTMTQNDIDNGRMICLIGVAPTMPAEFVIFRIGQWTAGAKVA